MKNYQDLLKSVRGLYERELNALDKVLASATGAIKEELTALRTSLNEQLAKLPPLDQVPAAQDAAWAMNALENFVARFNEVFTSYSERLNKIGQTVTSMNSYEERIKSGDLVTKDAAKAAADIARQEGIESMKPEVIATRKTILETAGLPVPDDKILSLPATEFNALHADVAKNLKAAEAKGMSLKGKGAAFLKTNLWRKETEFAGEMTKIEDLIGTAKQPEAKPDPLLGGGAGGGGESKTKAKSAVGLV